MPRESGMIEHVDESYKKSKRAKVRVEGVRENAKDLCLESQGEGVVGQSLSYNKIMRGWLKGQNWKSLRMSAWG